MLQSSSFSVRILIVQRGQLGFGRVGDQRRQEVDEESRAATLGVLTVHALWSKAICVALSNRPLLFAETSR